ncbi:MAG: hypothetical protein ACON35_00025 [Candidatus Marinamargulisbacteria bacterium]
MEPIKNGKVHQPSSQNPHPLTNAILNNQVKQKLLHQLTNNSAGNYATADTARSFRAAMDYAFFTAIPNDNARFRSCIQNGLALQKQFFGQREKNSPPSLKLQQFNKHFKDSPSHLHISYMGTRTHAIDLVVTRNENGLFITVCNRGERGDHNIFETYQCSKSANFAEQHKTLNQILNAAYTAETNSNSNSAINDFYACFGEKALTPTEGKSKGFKPPPPTKDQKAENCVRASISAAHKWMATQEDCPAAHKAVKQLLITSLEQELSSAIRSVAAKSIKLEGTSPINLLTTLLTNEPTADDIKPIIHPWLRYTSERLDPDIGSVSHDKKTDTKTLKDLTETLLNIIKQNEKLRQLLEMISKP